jgi:hypothetical protein
VARYTRGPAPKLNLTAAEVQLLHEWNAWDTKLFDAVKVFLSGANSCAIINTPISLFHQSITCTHRFHFVPFIFLPSAHYHRLLSLYFHVFLLLRVRLTVRQVKAHADAATAKSFASRLGVDAADTAAQAAPTGAPLLANHAAALVPLAACAQGLAARWGEPIERLRRKATCGGKRKRAPAQPPQSGQRRRRWQRRVRR